MIRITTMLAAGSNNFFYCVVKYIFIKTIGSVPMRTIEEFADLASINPKVIANIENSSIML
jgi:hypothetical protein